MGETSDSGFKDFSDCWPYLIYPSCSIGIVSPTVIAYLATSFVAVYFFVNIIRSTKISDLDKISKKSISFWIFSSLTFILQIVQIFYDSPTFSGVWNNIAVYLRNIPFLLVADQSILVGKMMGKKNAVFISFIVDFLYLVVFICVVAFYIAQISIMNDDNCWSVVLFMWYSGTFFEIITKMFFIFCLAYTFVFETGASYLVPTILRKRMKLIAFLTSVVVFLWTFFQFAFNYYRINISIIVRGLNSSMVPIYVIHTIHIILEYFPMLMLIIASLCMGAISTSDANDDDVVPRSQFDMALM